ncbi:hypothetical protein GCM10010496_32590 [Streptomyces asoensis]|nr:hypothetical protein GCM10010496_32590 [Streptomyces asoensis]
MLREHRRGSLQDRTAGPDRSLLLGHCPSLSPDPAGPDTKPTKNKTVHLVLYPRSARCTSVPLNSTPHPHPPHTRPKTQATTPHSGQCTTRRTSYGTRHSARFTDTVKAGSVPARGGGRAEYSAEGPTRA